MMLIKWDMHTFWKVCRKGPVQKRWS